VVAFGRHGILNLTGLGDPTLHLGPFVLEPDLHSPGRHSKLVGEVHPGLLAGHLISLEYLFQDGQLVGVRPLALLLIVVLEGVGESAWELDAVELE